MGLHEEQPDSWLSISHTGAHIWAGRTALVFAGIIKKIARLGDIHVCKLASTNFTAVEADQTAPRCSYFALHVEMPRPFDTSQPQANVAAFHCQGQTAPLYGHPVRGPAGLPMPSRTARASGGNGGAFVPDIDVVSAHRRGARVPELLGNSSTLPR